MILEPQDYRQMLERRIDELERENSALREVLNRWKEICEINNLLTLTPAQFCAATDACKEGRDWAIAQTTMADVWDNCPRAEWLVWIAQKINAADDRTLRLFAVWCARSTPIAGGRVTGDLLTDPRSRAALEVAERYANGQATAARLANACADAYAYAAAYAADAATHADAAAAAYAAAYATTAYADAAAAYATTAAAYAAAYATATHADATSRLGQANQFRLMVANPFPRREGGAT